MYNSKTLDTIRQNIDRIDNEIHDLLIERAALAEGIAAAKVERGLPIVHPAREAKMIRRLLARHQGRLPKTVIGRIWRELVCAVSMLQAGLTAQAYCAEETPQTDLVIRNYFGSALPLEYVSSPETALLGLSQNKTDFAILPLDWPLLTKPLYKAVLKDQEVSEEKNLSLKIVQALPFVKTKKNEDSASFFVLSRGIYEESGDDTSYILFKGKTSKALENTEKVYAETADNGESLLILKYNGFLNVAHKDYQSMLGVLKQGEALYLIGGHPNPIYL